MINTEDIQLSKMSYTDKDFASLYPDMLDLAKQLTNKWDPSLSNESDPGVVLIKEAAFVADHNNYNVDKNILENFLPSATQEESVQNIVAMNGYNPRYYVSAIGEVTVAYNPSDDETFTAFSLPAFTLKVSNEDGVTYTQLDSLSISEAGSSYAATCRFIQGTVNQLEVNGSSTILLDNLDENNRIYFPMKYVAQNGVFINNEGETSYWESTNYLQTQPLKSKVYKIGYDSVKNTPYIEFPSDISHIIGKGLNINYIYTSGVDGNVGAGDLNTISDPTNKIVISDSQELIIDNFTVNNASSITNGKDPETIDEMYQSFQKIVGTFDTLVTCRDYSNAVNTLTNDITSAKLVSNSVVTDINSDYNNAFKVITFDQDGEYFETLSTCNGISKFNFKTSEPAEPEVGDIIFKNNKFQVYNGTGYAEISSISYDDFVDATEAMSQYDLCLYALKAFSMADYNKYLPYRALNNSYIPITSTKVDEIKAKLEDYKCISHNFRDNNSGDIICFKNYVPLNITIIPYSKIEDKSVTTDIINNIYKVISEKFNAGELNFGEELNWDSVYDEIVNADDRIKSIRLEDFDYTPVALIKGDNPDTTETEEYYEENLYDSEELLLTMVAKNVLAGRVCLFNVVDSEAFAYKFGEVGSAKYKDTVEISTVAKIAVETASESAIKSSVKTTEETIGFDISEASIKITQDPDKTVLPTETITIQPLASYKLKSGMVMSVYERVETETEGEYNYQLIATYKPSDTQDITIKNASETTAFPTIVFPSTTYSDVINPEDIEVITDTTTYSKVSVELLLDNYAVNPNEYIQAAYPNYYSDIIYPANVLYHYDSATYDYTIPADTDYTLRDGDQLYLNYTLDSKSITYKYTAGDIIRSTFDIAPFTAQTSGTKTKEVVDQYNLKNEIAFKTIASDGEIDHRVQMKTTLTGSNIPCYWIVNNSSNTLFGLGEESVILNSGEYFVYTNPSKEGMVIMGPGTKLTRHNDTSAWTLGDSNSITIKSITENGFETELDWQVKDFSGDNYFDLIEMNIFTFGEADIVSLKDGELSFEESEDPYIDNNWRLFNGYISYVLTDGTTGILETIEDGYYIRSRLDINTLTGDQKLYTSGDSSEILSQQVINITYEDGTQEICSTADTTKLFSSNLSLNLTGGDTTNLSAYSSYTLNVKDYTKAPIIYFKAKYTELSDTDTFSTDQYKKVNNYYRNITELESSKLSELFANYGEYKVIKDTTTVNPLKSKLYSKNTEYKEVELESSDNKYNISLDSEGYIMMPFHFDREVPEEGISDENYNQYIIPIYYNDNDTFTEGQYPITLKIVPYDEEVETNTYKLRELGSDTLYDTFTINSNEMYLLEVIPVIESSESSEAEEYTISDDIVLRIDIPADSASTATITVSNPYVHDGINQELNVQFTAEEVIGKIKDLIANSNKTNVKPYYIYTPDNSFAIQDEDFTKPSILWDPNNVVNNISIPQIDIANSNIDITKSLKGYKDTN